MRVTEEPGAPVVIDFPDFLGVRIFQPVEASRMAKMDVCYFKTNLKKYNKYDIEKLAYKKIASLTFYHADLEHLKEFKALVMGRFYEQQEPMLERRYDESSDMYYYKRVLVLLNPCAGKSRAEKMFENIHPFLKANGMLVKLVITKPDKYCVRLIEEMEKTELLSYDFILCLSGDGIPHEVLNGYMRRRDIDFKSEKLTLAMLPAGSGCALLENCMKIGKNATTLDNAIYSLCHLKRKAFNISKYHYTCHDDTQGDIYSFLSASYGYMADVDIYSEKLRFMGRARFDVYGAFKIMKVSTYNIALEYSEQKEAELPEITEPRDEDERKTIKDEVFLVFIADLPYISTEYRACPMVENLSDGRVNVQLFEKQNGRIKLARLMMGHTAHNPTNNHGLKEFLLESFKLTLDPKPYKRNLVIDGETYSHIPIKFIERFNTKTSFYSLI